MEVLVGTSGYSYPDWVGGFYPAGTRPDKMLSYYGRQFPLVELNFTFYRTPTPEMLDKEYGLKTPALKAVVSKDDNTSATFEFGGETKGADGKPDGGQYARQSQRPIVFVVNKLDVELLQKELRDRTIFTFDAAKVKALKLTGWSNVTGKPTPYEFERKGPDEWALKPPEAITLDSGKIGLLVKDLAGLKADRFIAQNPKIKAAFDKDEEKTGLTIEITIEGEDKPRTLTVVNLNGDKANLGEDKGYYASTPSMPGELFQIAKTKDFLAGPLSKPAYFFKQ